MRIYSHSCEDMQSQAALAAAHLAGTAGVDEGAPVRIGHALSQSLAVNRGSTVGLRLTLDRSTARAERTAA